MSIEIYHPFEVAILPGLTAVDSLHFSVNSAKVFNFYNPLNYRNVKCDRNGSTLPSLPFSLKESSSVVESKIFPIESSWSKIYIYLFCSFLPPKNWSPSTSFIPFIDNAWIVYKSQDGFIGGKTKNEKPSHIKYQTFRSGLTVPSTIPENQIEKTKIEYGNAINYSPIASIEKVNDKWIVNQFLKDDLPITTLFDSSSFELHNTDLYKLSEEGDYAGSPSFALMKQQVSEIFGIPTTNILKGYVRADIKLSSPLVTSFTYKIDKVNRLGFENISSLIPVLTPVSDIPSTENKPKPDPYPDPDIIYVTPPRPTGDVKLPN